MRQKRLSSFFLLLLMIPTSIEIWHVLENHEHGVCTSINDQHIHSQNINCSAFHKHLILFSMDFAYNYDVIPTHYYTTIFADKPQTIKEVYHSKKRSRGPPIFIV